jgi:hypothetical protein
MNWFCYERHPSGRRVPVLYDERPDREWDMCTNVDFGTLREIPEELRQATLAEVTAWVEAPQVVPRPDRETELLEANNREVELRRKAEAERDALIEALNKMLSR